MPKPPQPKPQPEAAPEAPKAIGKAPLSAPQERKRKPQDCTESEDESSSEEESEDESDSKSKKQASKSSSSSGQRTESRKPRRSGNPGKGKATPASRAAEYKHQMFTLEAGKLFCEACRQELRKLKNTNLQRHCDSQKHQAGLEKVRSRSQQRSRVSQYLSLGGGGDDSEVCHDIPEQILWRFQVVSTFLGAGIPISKLEDPDIRSLLEDRHYALGSRRTYSQVVPKVLEEELEFLRRELTTSASGTGRAGQRPKLRDVGVIFDGSTKVAEVCYPFRQ